MDQTSLIRAHLKRHNSITLTKYGCMRLAARIYDLRRSGFSVVAHLVNRGGKKFSKYVMG